MIMKGLQHGFACDTWFESWLLLDYDLSGGGVSVRVTVVKTDRLDIAQSDSEPTQVDDCKPMSVTTCLKVLVASPLTCECPAKYIPRDEVKRHEPRLSH